MQGWSDTVHTALCDGRDVVAMPEVSVGGPALKWAGRLKLGLCTSDLPASWGAGLWGSLTAQALLEVSKKPHLSV